MPDPIQRNSSVPLSRTQVKENLADTRDISSPASTNASATQRSKESRDAKADADDAEFGKSVVKVVEKTVRKSQFDAADNISENSVYLSPDQGRPL